MYRGRATGAPFLLQMGFIFLSPPKHVISSERQRVEKSIRFRMKQTGKIPPRGFALVGMTACVVTCNRAVN